MYEETTVIRGKNSGPKSVIFAGVHGNEKCGVIAFEKLLPDLKIENGEVLFAYGNPHAIIEHKRLIQTNLNRMFKKDVDLTATERESYEYKRAQILKKYLDEADVLLDIHASNSPDSRPFIICERNGYDVARYLPIDTVIYGFDELEPGGTDFYMNSTGKIGICLECGFTQDLNSSIVASENILAFLVARGHISGEKNGKTQSYIQMYQLYHTKTDNFVLEKPFADFERISEGQIIGKDGEEIIKAPKDSIILFAKNHSKASSEAFLLGEGLNW